MQKKHIITIAGKPGSGKSTVSKAVATELGYQHFSSGDLFRALGKERGINLLEANLSSEQGTDMDQLVDQRLRDIGTTEDYIVIDSRTAWHWIPTSFKVYLELDLLTAAERILQGTSAARLEVEHIPNNPNEYAHQLKQRLESEARRYQNFYTINPYDASHYDLVIDSKGHQSEEVIAIVLKAFQDWLKKDA